MARKSTLQRTPHSRVFLITNGAGPNNEAEYLTRGRALGGSVPLGDVTPIRTPSETAYDQFEVEDVIRGQPALPTGSIELRMTRAASEILSTALNGCPFDLQVHVGACKDPSDFLQGWEKIHMFEGAFATSYDFGELGAFDADANAPVMETLPFTFSEYYEVLPVIPGLQAAANITDEVLAIIIADKRTCGECGIESDGAQVVVALIADTSGSPGLPAEVVYTQNAGATWADRAIATLGMAEAPIDIALVGIYVVVTSTASNSIHYIELADLLAGTGSWTELTTGFVGGGTARKIFSLGRTRTWVVGSGGYIYFSDDITAGFEVQDAGVATVQVLNDIHGIDRNNLVAVGVSNAVVVTKNGGRTWASVTGPAVGVALNTVWMRSDFEWYVGTADGRLFYTRNSGQSWTEKAFSGSGAGQVRDIKFATPSVGYMAHETPTPVGRIFRTIDGGNSWYLAPEESTGLAMPAFDRINSLAIAPDAIANVAANVVFGGGLADDAQDGVIVKLVS